MYGHTLIPDDYLYIVKEEWFKILESQSVKDVEESYSLGLCNLYNQRIEFDLIIGKLIDCEDKTLANLAVIRLILRRFKHIDLNSGWMDMGRACKELKKITPKDVHKVCN